MILDCDGNPVEVEPIPERPPVDEFEEREMELQRRLIEAAWNAKPVIIL